MEYYLKAVGLILVAVILSLLLSSCSKNYTVLLVLAVCAIVGISAIRYLEPVIVLFRELQSIGGWNHEFLTILLKSVGLGFLTEITVMICADSGNTALGKVLQLLSNSVILWIGLPLFTGLMEMIGDILKGI